MYLDCDEQARLIRKLRPPPVLATIYWYIHPHVGSHSIRKGEELTTATKPNFIGSGRDRLLIQTFLCGSILSNICKLRVRSLVCDTFFVSRLRDDFL